MTLPQPLMSLPIFDLIIVIFLLYFKFGLLINSVLHTSKANRGRIYKQNNHADILRGGKSSGKLSMFVFRVQTSVIVLISVKFVFSH